MEHLHKNLTLDIIDIKKEHRLKRLGMTIIDTCAEVMDIMGNKKIIQMIFSKKVSK
uniref:Uncharacterized protein n=1 Tax=Manihot esculenta TaxID=3983 RepID=A0A2C9UEX7_MANES